MTEPSISAPEDPAIASGILKAEFGERWRWWAWFRKQWSATSLTVVLGGLGTLGGWALNLKTRVVILETKVIPVIQDEGAITTLKDAVAAHDQRISRLENNWDDAKTAAGTAPVPAKRRK
ncbi:MAG TPA: hypothetical protein VK803_07995 [Steroidobacteraceae bacterium]|jgi:hypothetical protein|nr:hypothetical protein [Steroidobacteraceae bacterium]